MKIGIDGRALQGFIEGRRAGVGRYVFELCRELDELLPSVTFIVYSQEIVELPFMSDRWILKVDRSIWAKILKPVLWTRYRIGWLSRQDNLSLFWAAATFLPRFHESIPCVTTVYDLNFKVVPETMPRWHRLAFVLFFERDLRRATVVTSISEGTSKRLQAFYGRGADVIVKPAVGREFTATHPEDVRRVLSKYEIKRPFVLAVGTREPRKNLLALLAAFEKLKSAQKFADVSIILAGGAGWGSNTGLSEALKQSWVKSLGYVPDADLAALYEAADLFVFPSIYEGFGIPVAEALSCGARVIAADVPEIREAGGNCCLYTDTSISGLIRSLEEGMGRPKGEWCGPEANVITWLTSARTLVDAFSSATVRGGDEKP